MRTEVLQDLDEVLPKYLIFGKAAKLESESDTIVTCEVKSQGQIEATDDVKVDVGDLDEIDIENYFNSLSDESGYTFSTRLIKQRKLNRANIDFLNYLYRGKCQICGINTGSEFNANISEGHHIEYYRLTQNNKIANLMLLCPNHHSIIHKVNPVFDRSHLAFLFPNGKKLKLQLNEHLEKE